MQQRKNTHKKTHDKAVCQVFFSKLLKVVYSSTTLCFCLSYLCIYLTPESKRIGNKWVRTCNTSGSYRNCSEVENTPHDALFDMHTLPVSNQLLGG